MHCRKLRNTEKSRGRDDWVPSSSLLPFSINWERQQQLIGWFAATHVEPVYPCHAIGGYVLTRSVVWALQEIISTGRGCPSSFRRLRVADPQRDLMENSATLLDWEVVL